MNEDAKRARDRSDLTFAEMNYGASLFHWFQSDLTEVWLKKSSKIEPDLTQEGRVKRETRFNEIHAEVFKYMSDTMADLKKKKPQDEKEVKNFAQKQVASLKVLLEEAPEFDETFVATVNRLITSLESSVIQAKDFNAQVIESFFLKQREELKYPLKRFSPHFY